MKAPPKIIELDFITFELYETYAITSIKEGTTFKNQHIETVFKVFNDFYKDKPFVSIANRIHDYTIDPTVLRGAFNPNILGIAVAAYNETTRGVAAFEKTFFNGIYEIFDSLEDAISWAEDLYEKKAGL